MPNIAFINGRFLPLEEAMVSVEDRGYQFGDGVYEVIRTYGRRPFQVEAHLQRLERSAGGIGLALPFPSARWPEYMTEGIRLAGFSESKIYLQVTRGVAPRDHAFPQSVPPTAVMTVREMHPLDPELRRSGVSAVTLADLRWSRCDIKSINLLANVMARQWARDNAAFEAIFVRGGQITEGSVSNVMAVRNGLLITPREDERILSGVTRTLVLSLARKTGIPVQERNVTLEELQAADEVFLTGTTLEILSVVSLDGKPVGRGTPGEISTRLHRQFEDCIR
jgi:D-alanine transaminase